MRVGVAALGEERGEAEDPAAANRIELPRIVPFDPGVEAAIADLVADEPDLPHAAVDAAEVIRLEVGRQIDRDVVGTVGRVIELVVDRDRGAARQPVILHELARLDGDPLRARWRFHGDRQTILRSVPDLQFVLRSILDAVADDDPIELDFEACRRHAAFGMDAAHDPAEVAFGFGFFLPGISGGHADRTSGRSEAGIEPP